MSLPVLPPVDDATFRDDCAITAMAALLQTFSRYPHELNPTVVARHAYGIADAMLAIRGQS